MLTALLRSPKGTQDKGLESPHFNSVGAILRNADGETVATHRAGIWRSAEKIYISVDFETPVTVEFRRPELSEAAMLGPYPKLRIINNGMWALADTPQLLAEFEPGHQQWKVLLMRELTIPEIVIRPSQ